MLSLFEGVVDSGIDIPCDRVVELYGIGVCGSAD